MRILGIDPGYGRLGVAVVERLPKLKEQLLFSACLTTNKDLPHEERLAFLGATVKEKIRTYAPNVLAIEKLFFNTNQKTALRVAEVRGMIINEASSAGLKIFEYTPQQIKVATTGYGKSDKQSVMIMIPKLISLGEVRKRHDDEYDAIAVALTCLASERLM